MQTKDMVTMDNRLVRASYRLSVNELRLLLVIMAQMPKGDEQIDPKQAYYVTKDDFVRLGCEPKNVAREIRNACSDLLGRKVFINLGYGMELHTHWVHNVLTFKTETFERLKAQYPTAKNDDEFINQLRLHNLIDCLPFILKSDENLMARIVLHDDIIPYVCQLKKNFTKINPEELARLGSFYSYRIYFLLMQWRSTGKVVISISDLRDEFELADKYTLFADFKKRVLDVAVDEISKYTEYDVKYNLIKKGRKYTHVEFKFKEKTPKSANPAKIEGRDTNTVDMFDNLTDKERQIADSKLAWADQQGITDPLHRQNIVNKGIKQHRQAQQAEQERQAQAKAQAKAKAQAELERQQAEQAKKDEQDAERQAWLASFRWHEYVADFDALDDEQQAIIMQAFHDEIEHFDKDKAKVIMSQYGLAKRMGQSLSTVAIAISEEQRFVWTVKEQLDTHGW